MGGDNEMGFRKIMDMTRLAALVVLLLHCYYYCYAAFKVWGLRSDITDRLLMNIMNTGLFKEWYISKLIALGLLVISLLGALGKKDEKLRLKNVLSWLVLGLVFYFSAAVFFKLNSPIETIAIIYMSVSGTGFILVLSSGILLSRLLKVNLSKDIFNELNETFPQEERLLNNEYSINLPAR